MRKVLITILLLSLFVVKQAFASFSLLDLASLNGQLSNNAILCIISTLYIMDGITRKGIRIINFIRICMASCGLVLMTD